MNLDHPALLLSLLALLPLIRLLHRRRRRLPVVVVRAPFLLPAAARRGGGGGGDWRDRLQLLLRLALAAVIVLALAQPWRRGQGPERLVVVVPHGLAMALPLADGRPRYQAALDDARRALQQARPARALVLLAAEEPLAASGWTSPDEAVDAARDLAPGLGRSDLAAARREALRLAGPTGVVIVAEAPPAALAGNRAILDVSFTASRAEPNVGLLGVRLRSWEARDDTVKLALQSAAGSLPEVSAVVPNDGETLVTIRYRGPGGGPLRVSLIGSDPFAADDEGWIELPSLAPRRVALLGPPQPELERALRAIPRLSLQRRAADELPGEVDLVVSSGAGLPRADAPASPPWVVVAPADLPLLPLPLDEGPGLLLDPAETRPGLLALAGLTPRAARRLPPPPTGGRILARLGDEPAIWRASGGALRLALAFDPGEAGLAGSALHAVLWDDLLDTLLLPADGDCPARPVGSKTPSGPLPRPGVFHLAGQCWVATLPFDEELPAAGAPPALTDGLQGTLALGLEEGDDGGVPLAEAIRDVDLGPPPGAPVDGGADSAGPDRATAGTPAPPAAPSDPPRPDSRRPLAGLLAWLALGLLVAERRLATRGPQRTSGAPAGEAGR